MLDEIKDEYDAFYIANKYESDVTKTTHGTQFAKLLELKGDKVTNPNMRIQTSQLKEGIKIKKGKITNK